jgi:hypothetical protein
MDLTDDDLLSNKMKINLYMFRVLMLNDVGGEVHNADGVEDDVHQLVDIEDRDRLKMEVGDDCVFVGQRGGGDDLRGRGWRRRWGGRHVLSGSGSRLFEGSSLDFLFLKESGGLNVTTCHNGFLLGILALLDDGLEPSSENSGVGGGRHGDCRGGGGALLRAATRYWCCPTEDNNWVVVVP